MACVKRVLLLLGALPMSACTMLYSGDGKYMVDGYYPFTFYSIEFPEVQLDQAGVYVYKFDNFYAVSSRRLEFDVSGDDYLVPVIISTHVKVEAFDSRDALVAYMEGPINGREMFYRQPHDKFAYPMMSWTDWCSRYNNSKDYDDRTAILVNPGDQRLLEAYRNKYKITQCRYAPDYSTESPYYSGWNGSRIYSFHQYNVVLTISQPNPALKGVKGRLALRSGWK